MRIHGLHTNTVWFPAKQERLAVGGGDAAGGDAAGGDAEDDPMRTVLVSRVGTSGGLAECVFDAFRRENPDYPLKFQFLEHFLRKYHPDPDSVKQVYITERLPYEELAKFRSAVWFPYDTSLMLFWELYSANVPVFVPARRGHLLRWMWGQHTRFDLAEWNLFQDEARELLLLRSDGSEDAHKNIKNKDKNDLHVDAVDINPNVVTAVQEAEAAGFVSMSGSGRTEAPGLRFGFRPCAVLGVSGGPSSQMTEALLFGRGEGRRIVNVEEINSQHPPETQSFVDCARRCRESADSRCFAFAFGHATSDCREFAVVVPRSAGLEDFEKRETIDYGEVGDRTGEDSSPRWCRWNGPEGVKGVENETKGIEHELARRLPAQFSTEDRRPSPYGSRS
eukprot:g14585.t1